MIVEVKRVYLVIEKRVLNFVHVVTEPVRETLLWLRGLTGYPTVAENSVVVVFFFKLLSLEKKKNPRHLNDTCPRASTDARVV